jgi:ABC-type transport system substrate-binding protein
MLHAVNWSEAAGVSGLENSQITGYIGADPINLLQDMPHDPGLSRELLAGAGYPDGVPVMIFFPPGDLELETMAKMMVEFLGEGGFEGNLQEANADLDARLAMMEAAGEGFILLGR